jgi:membrane-associated phospholipid phosphatase
VRPSTAIRAAAVTVLAAGVSAPLVRRRLKLPPPVVTATAAAAPFALCVIYPRSRARDVGTCVLQMWAYVATYEMPNDDPEALERRARVEYPVRVDRFVGRGTTPTLRLQRALAHPGGFRWWEKALVWSHWLWFTFPHGTVVYLLLRHRDRFPRGAVHVYATFDIGVIGYWAVPTAPPWYAAKRGLMDDGRTPEVRRMMVEYGQEFWGSGWDRLYGLLGGNPLAAMPSLHFATSVMAAHMLAETGPAAGAVAWTYAGTLGIALVYLGEHYVVDLAAGLALAQGIRRLAPVVAPAVRRISAGVQALEARARP